MIENKLTETYSNIVHQLEGNGTLNDVRPLPDSFSNESVLLVYETAVRQNFSNFMASALKRANLKEATPTVVDHHE